MSSSDAFPPIPDDVAALAGPLLLGHMLNWCLFGALSVQIFMYHMRYPEDSRFNKLFVTAIYLWEAVQTFVLTENAFEAFARGYGNVVYLDRMGHLWFSVPVMCGVVAFASQAFYAYRINRLAQSRIVPGVIVLLAFIQLGGALACGVQAQKAGLHSRFLGRDSYITAGIWSGGSALCDVIIAVYMTIYLPQTVTVKEKETNNLLRKLIRLILETGTLTAVVAVINLALISLPVRPNYYMTTVGILGKLYANSTLTVLNSRSTMGENGRDLSEVSTFNAGTRVEPNIQSTFQMTTRAGTTTERASYSSAKSSTEEPFPGSDNKLKEA